MFRQTKSINDKMNFDAIFLVGLSDNTLPEYEKIDGKRTIWRARIIGKKTSPSSIFKIIKLLKWYLAIRKKFNKHPIKMINCHNLSSLPIAVYLKIKNNSILVYDTHELETKTLWKKGILKPLSEIIEKILMPYVDLIFVVSDEIGKWYKKKFPNKTIYTVNNTNYIPAFNKSKSKYNIRKIFNIPKSSMVFIHSGYFTEGRNIKLICRVFNKFKDKHIIFMGVGSLYNIINKYSRLNKNIHIMPAVESKKTTSYLQFADAGITLSEKTCLSIYLAVPAKFYEYIAGGLPIISDDFSGKIKLVNKFKLGWVIKPTFKNLYRLVSRLKKTDIKNIKTNIFKAREILNWKIDENKYIDRLKDILQKN